MLILPANLSNKMNGTITSAQYLINQCVVIVITCSADQVQAFYIFLITIVFLEVIFAKLLG